MQVPSHVALVSDAGTPLISDPGMPLVRAARAGGHYVTGLPGASAPILALSMAGLPTDRFCFAGFLPPKQSGRRKALQALLQAPTGTLVVFEAARRLTDLLGDLHSLAPQAEICVARELTKKFETLRSGSAEDLLAYFENDPPRGEVTVLISAAPMEDAPSEAELDAMLRDAMVGMSRRDAVQNIAELTGLPRKQVYARALLLGEEPLNNMSDTMSGVLSGGADTVLNEKEEEEDNEEQEEPAFDGSAGEAGPV